MMTFNLEQIKDFIYVANCFEDWTDNHKMEPIEIKEDIPLNLWNLFRIYLYRFCNENTVLILPPIKKIPAGYLSGTFGSVQVSASTEFVCEKAFTKANIRELIIPSSTLVQNGASKKETVTVNKLNTKEINYLGLNLEKYQIDFARIKAIFSFGSEKNINTLADVMENCNTKELTKKRITVLPKKQFVEESGTNLNNINSIINSESGNKNVSIINSVLIFDTGIIINNIKSYSFNRLKCYAFIFETEDYYLFLCRPLKICSSFKKSQLSILPAVLERWMEVLHEG